MSTEFTPPGPGQWQLDRSHFPGGATPIMQTLISVAVESAYRKQWPILGIPGMRDALRAASAPVVGVAPVIGGRVVRGMADACLTAIGVDTDAAAIARHYGTRHAGGVLDGWLVAEEDAASVAGLTADGIASRAVPLWMRDADTSATLAGDAIALAQNLR